MKTTIDEAERSCPNCQTPLWRRQNFEPKSRDFWDDYMDSPNREEHTYERCELEQMANRWRKSEAENVTLRVDVAKYKEWLAEAIRVACAASNDAEAALREADFYVE